MHEQQFRRRAVEATGAPAPMATAVRGSVDEAFLSGLNAGCLTAAAVCLARAFFVLAVLPAHPIGERSQPASGVKLA